MAIYKIKRFNDPAVAANPQNNQPPPTSKDLQIEHMRLQRQLLMTQRARDKARQEEAAAKMRRQIQAQRLEQKKEEDNDKRLLQSQKMVAKRMENNNDAMPPSLVKGRTHAPNTVSVNK